MLLTIIRHPRGVCGLALVITTLLAAGCQSTGVRQAAATSDTVATAAQDLEAARNQIDSALVSLDRLVNQPNSDLRPAFSDYRDSVSELESSVAALERRSAEISQRRQNYISAWEQQNAAITDPAVRARSEARQLEVDGQLAQLEQSYQDAREDLIPLLNQVRDIERLLSMDLTAAGIANARNLFGQTDRAAQRARESVARLAQEFRVASTLLEPDTVTIAE